MTEEKQESTDFSLMDREDEEQILEELRGVPAEKFIYKNNRGQFELSYAGTKWVVRQMANMGEAIRIELPKCVQCPIDAEHILVDVVGKRWKIDRDANRETLLDTNVGSARGWIKQKKNDGEIIPDEFFYNKTVSKATRNVMLMMIPPDLKKEMISRLMAMQTPNGPKQGARPTQSQRPQGGPQNQARPAQQQQNRPPQQSQQPQQPQQPQQQRPPAPQQPQQQRPQQPQQQRSAPPPMGGFAGEAPFPASPSQGQAPQPQRPQQPQQRPAAPQQQVHRPPPIPPQAPAPQRPPLQQQELRPQGAVPNQTQSRPDQTPRQAAIDVLQQRFEIVLKQAVNTNDRNYALQVLQALTGYQRLSDLPKELIQELGPVLHKVAKGELKLENGAVSDFVTGEVFYPKPQPQYEEAPQPQAEPAPAPQEQEMF